MRRRRSRRSSLDRDVPGAQSIRRARELPASGLPAERPAFRLVLAGAADFGMGRDRFRRDHAARGPRCDLHLPGRARGRRRRSPARPAAAGRRARVSPRWPRQTDGLWRYFLATFSDPALWRTQAYLLLRAVLGGAVAASSQRPARRPRPGRRAGALLAIPSGVDVGHSNIHSLAVALAAVPVGALAVIATMATLARSPGRWGGLSATLLQPAAETLPRAGPARRPALVAHAASFAGVNLFLIRDLGADLARLLLAGVGDARPGRSAGDPRLGRAGQRGRSRAGTSVGWTAASRSMPAFGSPARVPVGVWAITGGGYFWPVWVLLLAASVALGAHAAALISRAHDSRRSQRVSLRSSQAAPAPSTCRRPSCVASSATCTMAPKRDSSRSA